MTMSAGLLLVLLLTGCVGNNRWSEWWRTDGDYARFETDRYACQRDATFVSGGTLIGMPVARGISALVPVGGGPMVSDEVFIPCMNLKGWMLRLKS